MTIDEDFAMRCVLESLQRIGRPATLEHIEAVSGYGLTQSRVCLGKLIETGCVTMNRGDGYGRPKLYSLIARRDSHGHG